MHEEFNIKILYNNNNKTEACIFSRADIATIDISVNGVQVRTRNVIGVLFDSKLKTSDRNKYSDLINYLMENGLRHASGPIHTKHPIRYIHFVISYFNVMP